MFYKYNPLLWHYSLPTLRFVLALGVTIDPHWPSNTYVLDIMMIDGL